MCIKLRRKFGEKGEGVLSLFVRRVFHRPYLIIFIMIVAFQNCSPGFSSFSVQSIKLKNSQEVSTESGSIVHKMSLSELQPFVHKFSTGGSSVEEPVFPNGLPKGVNFDKASLELTWLPQKGQSGTYNIPVRLGNIESNFNLSVSAVNEQVLKTSGPPFQYQDGDIGYIFIHGAGNSDRCADQVDLANYWGESVNIIAPDVQNRTITCYNGSRGAAEVAKSVAEQMLNAKCGRFGKCIVVTHSMGGLVMEHILLHARAARSGDVAPELYTSQQLYEKIRDKTLFVVSLASSAGGSKSASILNGEGANRIGQELIAKVSRAFGLNDAATQSVVVSYASNVLAPMREDPGVPVFMVPGYSIKTLREELGLVIGYLGSLINNVPSQVFNADRTLAIMDSLTEFSSRSDGLVDFRSACGVMSDNENDGVGREVNIEEHFRYCFNAVKKSNHYVWFMTSLNHFNMSIPFSGCRENPNSCVSRLPNGQTGSFIQDLSLDGLSAVEVIRKKLGTIKTSNNLDVRPSTEPSLKYVTALPQN